MKVEKSTYLSTDYNTKLTKENKQQQFQVKTENTKDNDSLSYSIYEDEIPFKTIYNNASMETALNNKIDDDKTDKEINREVDMRIYARHPELAKRGIKFGSAEFKAWQEETKGHLPIPLDACANVRKELSDMIDNVKDPMAEYRLCKGLWRGFKGVDASKIENCVKVVNKVLNDSNDYLTLLKMNDDGQFKDVINYYSEMSLALTKCKYKLDKIVNDENNLYSNDPVAEGISRNVKDPIDREEDLLFWNNISKGFKLDNNTYEEFKKLKSAVIGFPPPSAPGRVRRAYREYMEKLPPDVRDKTQGILTFTYAEIIKDKNINPANWQQVLNAMKSNIGRIGDLNTDFDFIRKCINDFSEFNK